jgi:hypothetical protein
MISYIYMIYIYNVYVFTLDEIIMILAGSSRGVFLLVNAYTKPSLRTAD